MVDVSTWNFGADSAFLVGPVVGRVTANTARILVESSLNVVAQVSVNSTNRAPSSGADIGSTKQQALTARKPTVVTVGGLQPGQRVAVSITLGRETRSASFTTPAPNRKDWRVGLVSCNKISLAEKVGLWERMQQDAPNLDVVLHMGDQVYGDDDVRRDTVRQKVAHRRKPMDERDTSEATPEGCWARAQELVTADGIDTPADLESFRPQIKDLYAILYRDTWSYPATAASLASVSNLMILDDHEIADDAGDKKEHQDPKSWQYFVMGCAYQVYLAYQGQLNGAMVDPDDWQQRLYTHTEVLPGVGLLMLDVRLERSLLRHQQQGADWKDMAYLGPRQWADIEDALSNSFSHCNSLIVVSPTPMILVNSQAAKVIEKAVNDVAGSWSYPTFKNELRRMLEALSDWQAAKPDRSVCVAAGDVHIGGFLDVQLARNGPVLTQFTASAIANMPDSSTALKWLGRPALAVADMHASMRVNHTKWAFEPNYGILTIGPPSGEGADAQRPSMRGELRTKGKTRTHDFQYSLHGVVAQSCHGCKCTIS